MYKTLNKTADNWQEEQNDCKLPLDGPLDYIYIYWLQ